MLHVGHHPLPPVFVRSHNPSSAMGLNPVCDISDVILFSETITSGSVPDGTPQSPTTTTDGDEQQRSDGEHEPVDC